MLERRVGVAKGDDWDVDVRSLLDGLSIKSWVGDDDQSWLGELAGDVVGEGTWGETTSHWGGSGVGGVLEDSTLTEWTSRDGDNIGWVVDGNNGSFRTLVSLLSQENLLLLPGSENNLLPGLANVDDIDSIRSGLPEVWLHVNLAVLASEVGTCGEHHLDILESCVHDGWQLSCGLCWGHVCGLN